MSCRVYVVGVGMTACVAPGRAGDYPDMAKQAVDARSPIALVGEKNHRHSANNPCARSQQVRTLEEILASPPVHGPLTELQCSSVSDGAAAAVLMSEAAVCCHGLADHTVEIAGQAVIIDLLSTFEPRSAIALAGTEMAREAARRTSR